MVEWQFLVDWNQDGDFSDAGEDITAYVLDAEWELGIKEPYGLLAHEQRAQLTLNNLDKRFSPEYSGGPYYGSLVPQRNMLIRSVSGGTTTHWRGWVDEIQPAPGVSGALTTTLTGVGAKQFFEQTVVHLPLQTDVTADEVLAQVMGKVQYPPALDKAWLAGIEGKSEAGVTTWASEASSAYTFETGKTTFAWVDLDNVSAWQVVSDLVEAERGHFFFDREGKAVFWNRHHLLLINSVGGTISSGVLGMDYRYGAAMRNRIVAVCKPRSASAGTATLWQLDAAQLVRDGEEFTFRPQFSDEARGGEVTAQNVIQPNTGDGSLAYTGDLTVGDWEANARSATLTVTGGAAGANVTAVTVKGQALTTYNEQELVSSDALSITTYGLREMRIEPNILDNADFARSIADYELSRRKTPRGEIAALSVAARDSTRQGQMVAWTMGQRIRVVDTQLAADREYFILGEAHSLKQGLKVHETTWTLEPAEANKFWRAGVAGYSEAGQTTVAGY